MVFVCSGATGQANIVLATFNSPSVSPYRGFAAPVAAASRADSDLGYSTMTQHDDSEVASVVTEPAAHARRDRTRRRPGSASPPTSTSTGACLSDCAENDVTDAIATTTLLTRESSALKTDDLQSKPDPPTATTLNAVEGQTVLAPHQVLASVQVHAVKVHESFT